MVRSLQNLLWAGVFSLVTGAPVALAGDLVPPPVVTSTPGGVSLSDGSFTMSATDLTIGTLTLERHSIGGYRQPATPYFGSHMSHNFDIYVSAVVSHSQDFDHYAPVVHTGSSAVSAYVQDYFGSIGPQSLDAQAGDLTVSGGHYVFTDQSGAIYTFNASISAGESSGANSQRIDNIVYPNGRRLDFTYNSSKQLKVITDSNGYALVFDYGSNGYVSAACGFNLSQTTVSVSSTCIGAALKVSYGYSVIPGTSVNVLSSVTDVLGHVTTYGYQSYEISCIQPPGYSTCKVANNWTFMNPNTVNETPLLMQQTLADGAVWSFTYGGNYGQVSDNEVIFDDDNVTQVTDPLGKISTYYFTKGSPHRFVDANNNIRTFLYEGGVTEDASFTYANVNPDVTNYGSLLDEIDLPEGNKYKEEHAAPYLALSKRTWISKTPGTPSDVVEQWGYTWESNGFTPCPTTRQKCAKPIWYKDGKGNQTDYTYDSQGDLLTTTLPADQNGLRRRTYNTYTVFNTGSGNIYRLTRSETCGLSSGQLSLTACPAATTTAVTTTDYGDATTAPYTYKSFSPYQTTQTDGAGSLSATTTYTYDWMGNVTVVDGPRTDVDDRSYTVYDLAHRKLFEIGIDPDGSGADPRVIVHHVYDDDGREIRTEQGTGNATDGTDFAVTGFKRMTYDALDRVTKTEEVVP